MIEKFLIFFNHLYHKKYSNLDTSCHINRLKTPLFIHEFALSYRGKLLTFEEINLNTTPLKLLIDLHYFKKIPSISMRDSKLTCNRCENNNPLEFAIINCKRCGESHSYCRSCIQMNRVLSCEELYFWQDQSIGFNQICNASSWKGKLTKNQKLASIKAINALENNSDLAIWAVTGSGKTEIVFPVIEKALARGLRICIASPRADVIRELDLRLRTSFKKTTIESLYAQSPDKEGVSQLILSTTHQLIRYKKAFDLLIIDEVDAFPYALDERLKRVTKRARKDIGTTIFLTATPDKLIRKQIENKVLDGCFIPTRFHGFPLIIPRIVYCFRLSNQLKQAKLPESLTNILNNRDDKSRQLLIFVPTIELSLILKKEIIKLLIESHLITNQEQVESVNAEDTNRKEKVRAFRNKELYCLITTTILERGVTFPSIDVIVLNADHSLFNEAALVQIAGRAGRSVKDPRGNVIFMVDYKTNAINQCIKDLKRMNKEIERNKI